MPPVATGLILLMLLGRRGVDRRVLERSASTWSSPGRRSCWRWRSWGCRCSCGRCAPASSRSTRATSASRRRSALAAARCSSPSRCRSRGPSVLAGAVLAFARALGEFGATIMVAGSIPGVDADAGRRDLRDAETGQDRARRSLLLVSGGDRLRRAVVANRLVERRAGVIALDIELAQGTFTLDVDFAARRPRRGAVRAVRRRQDDDPRRDRRACGRRGAARSRRTGASLYSSARRRQPAARISGTSATCRRTSRSFRT